MELGLVKVAAKLFGTESDDLQGAAGTQVIGFFKSLQFTFIFYFTVVNMQRFDL